MSAQLEPAANPHRTALHHAKFPDGKLTARQRDIANAVRQCQSLADFTAAPKEQVTAVTIATIPFGTATEMADLTVRQGLARARAELDRMEAMFHAYGSAAFAPQAAPVPALALGGVTRQEIVVKAMRWAEQHRSVLVRAGDTALRLDPSGSYELDCG